MEKQNFFRYFPQFRFKSYEITDLSLKENFRSFLAKNSENGQKIED